MKKIISCLLVFVMLVSMCACSSIKDGINEALDEAKNDVKNGISDAVGNAIDGVKDSISNEISDATNAVANNAADAVVSGTVDAAISAVGRHDSAYWSEYFGTSRCPFSISALGMDFDYYFRAGGDFSFWPYTEENTGNWYVYDGYVISGDNTFAVKIEDCDSFSSCCTYTMVPYTGKTLTAEEQKVQQTGAFYVLNSYTPVRTNWGIQITTDGREVDSYEYTAYGLKDTFKSQEWFRLYVNSVSDYSANEKHPLEATKLWAFPHRDRSEYPEFLSEELMKEGIQLGKFEYHEDEDKTYVDAYIPNKSAGGFDAGLVDLLFTYGDSNYLTVAVVTVNTLAE